MPTPLEQLATAKADVARLTGFMNQIPGGDVSTFLAEYSRRGTELERLAGVEQQWTSLSAQIPGGDVPAFFAEHTRLGAEVARLTTELSTVSTSVEERAELRAAEIVAATGNQAPAAADVTGNGTGAPSTREQHWARHAEITKSQGSAEADKYYRANKRVMNSY